MSDETQSLDHFTAREKALVYIELEAGWGAGAGLGVLENMWLSCFCQDVNPRSSYSVY
jgi:hypothetical protein